MVVERGPALSTAEAWIADPRGGVALFLAAMILFAGLDTGVKHLASAYPILQIAWARYLFQMTLLPIIVGRVKPRNVFYTRRPGLQIIRSMLLVGVTLSFFTALRYMPLADAMAIAMVSPLMVTALASPLLGERVGRRRWTAVIIGFAGMLVIIRPGLGVVHWAVVLPLVSALGFALYQITTRGLAAVDPPTTTFFYTGIAGMLVLTMALPFVWQPPTVLDGAVMVAIGLLAGGGHYCVIQAMRRAQASALAPLDYTQLAWVTAFGYLAFGDFPDRFTIIGALIIVASGVYVFHRESVVKRPVSESPPTADAS